MRAAARLEDTGAGAWLPLDALAVGHERGVVRRVLAEEVLAGRVLRAEDGRLRLRPGAIPPEVAAALCAFSASRR